MSISKHKTLTTIEYPASDGKPMAETDLHRQTMIDLIETLKNYFASVADVYVSGNLMLYYVEDEPRKSVSPDVFVVRGVPGHNRRVYFLWKEGQAPNVVMEISSQGTKKEDLNKKKRIYADIGVKEYFIFDPEYKLKPPLRAYRLHGSEYIEEAVIGGRAFSAELGLELVNTGETLRLWDPQVKRFLPTPREEAQAHREAETRAAAAAAARRQAEARAAAAEAELARLRTELAQLQPPKPARQRRRK